MAAARTTRYPVAARAILPLARGLLAHPANGRLRLRLSRSPCAAKDFYRELQFFVCRIATLLLAEREGLPDADTRAVHFPGSIQTPCGKGISGLADCRLEERDYLAAVETLSRTPLDLAGLYQELLGLRPLIDLRARAFELAPAGTALRKRAGAYYTPAPLVECLLNSALDPFPNEPVPLPTLSIPALTVCDPSCGCGHFLVAAAQRIARRLA